MECKLVEELISQYIEGDVPQETHDQISIHLEQCGDCRDLKEKIEEMLYSLPDLEEEVPFFLKNRLLYIPESQQTDAFTEKRFVFMKWVAAAIGTFVLFLNLFYFTNFYPPANRLLHTVVAKVKTFTVESGAYIERVKESKAFSLFSIFKSKTDDNDKQNGDSDHDDKRDREKHAEDHLKNLPEKTGKDPGIQEKKSGEEKSGEEKEKEIRNKNTNLNNGGQND